MSDSVGNGIRVKVETGEIDDTTTCPGCYQLFTKDSHVPRILPCSHTTCEQCLCGLIRDNNFVLCPICRKKYSVTGGITAIPQNKYILKNLEANKFEMCKEHNRELSLYCSNQTCSKPVCQLCLIAGHMSHQVVDIVKEEEEDNLRDRIDNLSDKLEHWNERLRVARGKIASRRNTTIAKLKDTQKSFMHNFDELIQQAMGTMDDEGSKISQMMEDARKYLAELRIIRRENGKVSAAQMEAISRMEQRIQEAFGNKVVFKYSKYDVAELDEINKTRFCGQLIEMEESENFPSEQMQKKKNKFILDAPAYFTWIGLSDNTVAVVLREERTYKLSKFGLAGSVLCKAEVTQLARDLQEITLGVQPCVATSSVDGIKFYDVTALTEVLTYNCDPRSMCKASPTMLLYVEEQEVKWLDCSAVPPKPAKDMKTIHLKLKSAGSMCYVYDGRIHRVVVLSGNGALHAYDAKLGRVSWKIKDGDVKDNLHVRGVTSDGRDRLFVLDSSRNIHLLSSEGKYLRPICRKEDHDLGTIDDVEWHKGWSFLIRHRKHFCGSYRLSLINAES